MKRSRFIEERIIGIPIWQVAGMATIDAYRRHGVSAATFHEWNARNGGQDVSDARRLTPLADETAKLKKLPAEAMPDDAILKYVAAGNGSARCQAGSRAACRGDSGGEQAPACEALAKDRSSVRCGSARPDESEARAAMIAVAAERRRFGYRRIHIKLEQQGIVMNFIKLRRLYCEGRR